MAPTQTPRRQRCSERAARGTPLIDVVSRNLRTCTIVLRARVGASGRGL